MNLFRLCGDVLYQRERNEIATAPSKRPTQVSHVVLLLAAGAGPDVDLRNPQNQTALECAAQEHHTFQWGIVPGRRTVYGMLFAAGATFPPSLSNTADPYLQKIRAVGFPAYEKAHRKALATKFAAKAFPRLPTEVASQVVAFAFHVGYY